MSEKQSQVCCCCGENLDITNFFKSYSDLYISGYLPICKQCFTHKFGQFANEYHSNKKAMQRVCMAFDIYFDTSLFEKCDSNNGDKLVGNYFRKLNMSQYQGKTFEDTIKKEGFALSEPKNKNIERTPTSKVKHDITEDDIEKWGDGFDAIDYSILNSHYNVLTKSNPSGDDKIEIFIVDLCYIKMQQMKAMRDRNVEDFNKLTESYRKTYNQAGFKTTRDASDVEDFTIGVNAEIIEKYTPAEYYKNKKLYKDFDGLGSYFERFVKRPLQNLQFGSKDKDKEFCVKDEDEVDGFSDE